MFSNLKCGGQTDDKTDTRTDKTIAISPSNSIEWNNKAPQQNKAKQNHVHTCICFIWHAIPNLFFDQTQDSDDTTDYNVKYIFSEQRALTVKSSE